MAAYYPGIPTQNFSGLPSLNYVFKKGDRVICIPSFGLDQGAGWEEGYSFTITSITVNGQDSKYSIAWGGKPGKGIYFHALALYSKGGVKHMAYKLTKTQEANLSEDAKTLVKAGILDGALNVMDSNFIWNYVVQQNMAGLAKEAQVLLDAEKAEK